MMRVIVSRIRNRAVCALRRRSPLHAALLAVLTLLLPLTAALLEENSEFAAKWASLAASHLQEGIRDPIVAVEYLNRFYVVEGHKRVSVLRFFGATTVRAEVKRLLPPRSDDPEIAVYYEFLDFYKVTHVNYIRFSRLGAYPAMLKLLCGEDLTVWDEERRRSFFSDIARFFLSGMSRHTKVFRPLLRRGSTSSHSEQRS